MWAIYGESPMLSPPNSFPNDPYILFAGEFGDWVSGYGPMWELLVQLPLRLGFTDMVPGAISLKFLVLLFYTISSFLIGWVAWPKGADSGKAALAGLVIFAWNPMILLEGLGNGHNDMVLMALMVLGVILWRRKAWWAAAAALSLGALTKATGLLMLPLFGGSAAGRTAQLGAPPREGCGHRGNIHAAGASAVQLCGTDFPDAARSHRYVDAASWLCDRIQCTGGAP